MSTARWASWWNKYDLVGTPEHGFPMRFCLDPRKRQRALSENSWIGSTDDPRESEPVNRNSVALLNSCFSMLGLDIRGRDIMKLARIILADDHTLVTEALRQLVAPYFDVVATVADGRALLKSAESLSPEVIVVDVAMPLLNGLEACRQIKRKMPRVKFVFLTMNDDPKIAVEAMKAGASGYILKRSAASDLTLAIQAALRDKSYIASQLLQGMQESFIRDPQGKSEPKSITPRQREVVHLLAEGKTMKEAAAVLTVTPRTVAFHKYRVMQELGLKTNADLVQFAIKNQILVA
jgi:DNA-binding NarL/FixJ family response regulator